MNTLNTKKTIKDRSKEILNKLSKEEQEFIKLNTELFKLQDKPLVNIFSNRDHYYLIHKDLFEILYDGYYVKEPIYVFINSKLELFDKADKKIIPTKYIGIDVFKYWSKNIWIPTIIQENKKMKEQIEEIKLNRAILGISLAKKLKGEGSLDFGKRML
jgi:uncharacterized membrane protein (DUF106 family)